MCAEYSICSSIYGLPIAIDIHSRFTFCKIFVTCSWCMYEYIIQYMGGEMDN